MPGFFRTDRYKNDEQDAHIEMLKTTPPGSGCWLLAVGCWLLAVGCWQVAGGRWQVAGGRWQVAGGRWQVAGGVLSDLATIFAIPIRHTPNAAHTTRMQERQRVSPLAFLIAHDGRYLTLTIIFFIKTLWVHAKEVDPFPHGDE